MQAGVPTLSHSLSPHHVFCNKGQKIRGKNQTEVPKEEKTDQKAAEHLAWEKVEGSQEGQASFGDVTNFLLKEAVH